MPSMPEKLDPLYTIFEHQLSINQDEKMDRQTFVLKVVQEYIKYLRHRNLAIPRHLEHHVIEELTDQVSTMLTVKMYGHLSLDAFQGQITDKQKLRAKRAYRRIKKSA